MIKLPRRMAHAISEIENRRTGIRTRPTRAHFVNIFRVHEPETFWFADGKLFLDGTNGSGKSALMALLVPPAFDRNLKPERIDTAKSRSKHFHWHLTGNLPEGAKERTGYAAIEMMTTNGRKITFGYGAQAKKGSSNYVVWSFIYDGPLDNLQFIGAERIPISKSGMKSQMERLGGSFYDESAAGAQRYQESLNNKLFGFQTLEEYRSYLDFLTELRRPIIGTRLTVTEAEDVIRHSLPRVSPEAIRKAAETYSAVVEMQARAEQALEKARLVSAWAAAQNDVALLDTRKAFNEWQTEYDRSEVAQAHHRSLLDQIGEKVAEIKGAKEEIKTVEPRIAERAGDVESLTARINAMDGVRSLQREHEERVAKIKREEEVFADAFNRVSDDSAALAQAQQDLEAATSQLENARTAVLNALRELAQRYRTLDWSDLTEELYAIQRGNTSTDFTPFKLQAQIRIRVVKELRAITKEVDDATRKLAELKEELQAARHASNTAEGMEALQQTHWENAAYTFVDDTLSAATQVSEFAQLDFPVVREDVPVSREPGYLLQYVRDLLRGENDRVLSEYDERIASNRHEQDVAELEAGNARMELDRLRSAKDHTPDLAPAVRAARQVLDEAGIVAVPFYAAVEAVVDDLVTGRVEEMLADAGVLTRLCVASAADRDRALQILDVKGLADTLIVPGNPGGNLGSFLAPSPHAPFEESALLGLIRLIPLQLDVERGEWQAPGVIGKSAGVVNSPEFIGLLARQARRAALITQAEARVEAAINLTKEIQAVGTRIADRKSAFRKRYQALFMHEMRNASLDHAWRTLQTAVIDARAARVQWEVANRKEQGAQSHLNALNGRYREVKQREKWLPQSLSELDAERLIERMQDLIGDVDALALLRNEEARAIRERETSGLRYTTMAQRLESSQAQAAKAELELVEHRRALAEIMKALNAELPAYESLVTEREEVTDILRRLRDRKQHLDSDIKSFEAARDVLLNEAEKAIDVVRTATQVERERRSLLRAFLTGVPSLDAQLAFFEQAQMNEFREEMRSIGVPPTGTTPDQYAAKLRATLDLAHRAAAPLFVANRIEFNIETHIPTLQRDDVPERTDLWDMAERVERTAFSIQEDMTTQLRDGIETMLSLGLYDEMSRYIRQVSTSQKQLNAILEEVVLQRGQGNLRIAFVPNKKAALGYSGHGEALSGAQMINHFTIGDWGLRTPAEREPVISFVRSELESAYAAALSGATGESFEETIAARLDYRLWYTVEIERLGEDGSWHNLTKAHGAGSEGMKAMDMLQPMIACARLRLLGANANAPCLIAMDEVFAQLDQVHGTAILQVLKALGCDWILATEKGLHPTSAVDGAACYTVDYRDNELDVMPSIWTGKSFLTLGNIPDSELITFEDPTLMPLKPFDGQLNMIEVNP